VADSYQAAAETPGIRPEGEGPPLERPPLRAPEPTLRALNKGIFFWLLVLEHW